MYFDLGIPISSYCIEIILPYYAPLYFRAILGFFRFLVILVIVPGAVTKNCWDYKSAFSHYFRIYHQITECQPDKFNSLISSFYLDNKILIEGLIQV